MSMLSSGRRFGSIALAALAFALAAPAAAQDITVQVQRNDSTFVVNVEFLVPATVTESWDVLTDYDNMSKILSNVDASRIENRNGNTFHVVQKSHVQAGLIPIYMDSVRQVELSPPREIRSNLVKGNLKSSNFTTRVMDAGAQTRVTAEGTFVATGLAAATITVESVTAQTKKQYEELRKEILRRKNGGTPPCVVAKNCQPASGQPVSG